MQLPVIPFLICFPMLAAILMFVIRKTKIRNAIAYICAVIIIGAVGVLTIQYFAGGSKPLEIYFNTAFTDHVILTGEFVLMAVVTYLCFKYHRYWICLLSIIPTCMIAYLELFGPKMAPAAHIYIDCLSILMCIIAGLIGGLIIIYAVGYMHGYTNYHKDIEDRRNYFFMLLFLFLGAMFGFVLSDNLLWIDLFWETTSVCSFLLIGYTRESKAIRNSFRALWMNLLGGFALSAAIVYCAYTSQIVSFQQLIRISVNRNPASAIPIVLIAVAALTKAAQLPFSPWLLGAMIAPTPSSALLHSATMVKAGIYILIRLAPAMSGTLTGTMVALIGSFTFFAASVMAIAQSDAKKILALSTISNLGLMTACAGVGSEETTWACIFLMIFHAVSKSLLFQNVGATENSLHTRDVENFQGLLYRLPQLAIYQFIGIAGMFLAPFGMLISKWSALRASVDEGNFLLVMLIVFGSATTSFYWTKWMGKLLSRSGKGEVPDITRRNEKISMTIHAVLMITLCLLFPLLSKVFVDPMLVQLFGNYENVLPTALLYTLIVVIAFVFTVPMISYYLSRNVKINHKPSYMNGINTGNDSSFTGSFGEPKEMVLTNYYFEHTLGVKRLMYPSQILTVAVIIITLCIILGGVL